MYIFYLEWTSYNIKGLLYYIYLNPFYKQTDQYEEARKKAYVNRNSTEQVSYPKYFIYSSYKPEMSFERCYLLFETYGFSANKT